MGKLFKPFLSILLSFVIVSNMTGFHISAEEAPNETTQNQDSDNTFPADEHSLPISEDIENTQTSDSSITFFEETDAETTEDDEFQEEDISSFILQNGGFPEISESSALENVYEGIDQYLINEITQIIINGLESWQTEINIEEYHLTFSQTSHLYADIINFNPQLFFVKSSFTYKAYTENEQRYVAEIKPRYNSDFSIEDFNVFLNETDKILAGLKDYWNDEQKALYLHDALVILNSYDFTYEKFNAYNALVEHSSVCQGYALAYLYLCNRAGIKCDIVTSNDLGHAWNVVSINEKWYYVDCTWDDPIGKGNTNLFTQHCGHSNFLNSQTKHKSTGHNSSDWLNGNQESIYNLYNNSEYDNAYFKKSMVPITGIENLFAFINNGKDDSTVYVYDYSVNSSRKLATLPNDKWPVFGTSSQWTSKYWGLATDGFVFYVSGPQDIYAVSLDGKYRKIYTLTLEEQKIGYIYGIHIDGENIIYDLQRESNISTYQTSGSTKISNSNIKIESIRFEKPKTTIIQGSSEINNLIFFPANATDKFVSFTSSNQNIATVDSTGRVFGVFPGITIITAITRDGLLKANYEVTVAEIPPKSLEITTQKDVLYPNESTELIVNVIPENTSSKDVSWVSKNPDIAIVDYNGKVIAKSPGKATIEVCSVNHPEVSAIKIIYVLVPVENISIESHSKKLFVNQTISLKAKITPADAYEQGVIWSSSNENIATVSSSGLVKAIRPGTVIITVESKNNNSLIASTELTIEPEQINEVVISQTEATLFVNKVLQLTARTSPITEGIAEITWSSSNPEVATVDDNGIVKGNKVGETIINAVAQNGIKAQCVVTVKPNAVTMEVLYPEKENFFYYIGTPIKPSVVVYDGDIKLKEKTDYTLSFKNNKTVGTGIITVKMIGNYTGSRNLEFPIKKVSIKDENPALTISIPSLKYNKGKALKPQVSVFWNGQKLSEKKDYTVILPEDISKTGLYIATITGQGNFTGSRNVQFAVENTPVKSATISISKTKEKFSQNIYYDGNLKILSDGDFKLFDGNNELIEGIDYIVLTSTYLSNLNAGTASVSVQGIGKYSGIKKVKMIIHPNSTKIKEKDIRVVAWNYSNNIADVPFAKGGATPKIIINGLREGADFKVTYKNNKAVGNGTANITFIGNYKGTPSCSIPFNIVPQNISNTIIYASDITATTKKGNFAIKPTIIDINGKSLTIGKDYSKDIKYELYDSDGFKIKDLNPKTDFVNSDAIVRITVSALGNYTDKAYTTFHVINKKNSLSGAKVVIQNQEYTGLPIYLNENDIKVTLNNKTLQLGVDYKILTYTNNIKKGTAKITTQGMGNYGNVKTVSFKIVGKTITQN